MTSLQGHRENGSIHAGVGVAIASWKLQRQGSLSWLANEYFEVWQKHDVWCAVFEAPTVLYYDYWRHQWARARWWKATKATWIESRRCPHDVFDNVGNVENLCIRKWWFPRMDGYLPAFILFWASRQARSLTFGCTTNWSGMQFLSLLLLQPSSRVRREGACPRVKLAHGEALFMYHSRDLSLLDESSSYGRWGWFKQGFTHLILEY